MPRASEQQKYVLHRLREVGVTLSCLCKTNWAYSENHEYLYAGKLNKGDQDERVAASTVLALLRQATIVEVNRRPLQGREDIWHVIYGLVQPSEENNDGKTLPDTPA